MTGLSNKLCYFNVLFKAGRKGEPHAAIILVLIFSNEINILSSSLIEILFVWGIFYYYRFWFLLKGMKYPSFTHHLIIECTS